MPDPIATLTAAFDDPSTRHGGQTDHARPVAVSAWPTVPLEIVRAAGLRPVVMRGSAVPTPLADARLEAGVFPGRLRQLVEYALAGQLQHAACVVLPRTSDPDYKTFLYLRELRRRGISPLRAPILLYDLLQSDGPDVLAYDTARTRALFDTLASLSRPGASLDDVREAIAQANRARAAMRRLLALRRGAPRVSGVEVMPLIGAFWQLAPDDYAPWAGEAAEVLARRAPIERPRVLLAGAPVDGPALHAAIESHGAVVVAECGPWGSEAPGEDVPDDSDPFAAIAERYRRAAIGARAPLAAVRQQLQRLMQDVDAVVVSLPPDDAVFGWDYPALRTWMDAHELPHVCVSSDPCLPLTAGEHDRLEALIAAAAPRVEARHG